MFSKKFKKLRRFIKHNFKQLLLIILILGIMVLGGIAVWVSTFRIPDLSSFEERKVSQSTKIFDRTGKILLYDVHENIKRTIIPYENISRHLKNATVAIEDAEFYQHNGIKIKSIFRAVFANILSGEYSQGGSTITQQVVKNSLLTNEKKISRKLKEWFLALKIEKILSKEQILALYLNETPYGGNIYGVEEACRTFFGKTSSDLSLAESAYIAAIPQAPTFYSPYGNNKDRLEKRKNLVLDKMLENKFINDEEYKTAKSEVVQFQPPEKYGIRAPHFVEYIKQYLIEKYGQRAIEENGYKVVTTIDYTLQAKAEEIVKEYALENTEKFNASNAAAVATDPKTGQILMMVGSRDYFDKEIEGNFNVALANRQPGSTFKPFVYATAFTKGYTPETVLFDLKTEFQSTCTPLGLPAYASVSPEDCYMPNNYDNLFKGPMSLRSALAESRNIIALKVLYLAGIKDSLKTVRSMGITSLNDPDRYGLTLVLGGGEVSLLEMTGAYGVFANNGTRFPLTGIISIEDSSGNVLEKFESKSQFGVQEQSALQINSILSDDVAKHPAYGTNSPMYFGDREVASKTGTTNDYRDAWVIGYTPSIALGTWAGNNDNSEMEKKVAGLIVAPLWSKLMGEALANLPVETFKKPAPSDQTAKPVLRGFWQGNETYFVDKISGKLATAFTPEETREEKYVKNVHTILHWINKSDPTGSVPLNPTEDPQYRLWEYPIQEWLRSNPVPEYIRPIGNDTLHSNTSAPSVSIISPSSLISYGRGDKIMVNISTTSILPITRAEFYINGSYIGSSDSYPLTVSFVPDSVKDIQLTNELKVIVYDSVYNKAEATMPFKIR